MPVQYDIQTDNYVGSHNFQIAIDGMEMLNTEFVSVSGVVSTSEEVEFHHGVDPYVRKTAGRVSYEPVVMERVYKGVDDFYRWRLEVENGVVSRKNVTVTLLDSAFNPKRAMTLEMAWPSKWEMPDMDANQSGPAIERITLSVERVRESST
jgi:phage tail-like protein